MGLADKHISKAYEMSKKYNEKGSKLLKGKIPTDPKKAERLYKQIKSYFDKADSYHKKGHGLFDTQWKTVFKSAIKEGKQNMVKKASEFSKAAGLMKEMLRATKNLPSNIKELRRLKGMNPNETEIQFGKKLLSDFDTLELDRMGIDLLHTGAEGKKLHKINQLQEDIAMGSAIPAIPVGLGIGYGIEKAVMPTGKKK